MERLVIKTDTLFVYQHTQFGHHIHWGDALYVWNPGLTKVADIRWYRAESFWITDRTVARYHRLFDRVQVLEDLLEAYANYDYIWDDDSEDEYLTLCGYDIPYHDEAAKALLTDWEEYKHLLTTFNHSSPEDIVSELLADNALLRDRLEWMARN